MAFHEVRLASTHRISTLAISTDETKVAAILLPICKIIVRDNMGIEVKCFDTVVNGEIYGYRNCTRKLNDLRNFNSNIIWSSLCHKLLKQGCLEVKLKSSLRKFYGRHCYLFTRYGISVSVIHFFLYLWRPFH